jgi:DNA modification methylase
MSDENQRLGVDSLILHQDNYANVPNGSIDFLLTDPPFNIAQETNFHTYKENTIHSYKFDAKTEEQWDTFSHEDFIKELGDWSKEFARVLKKGGNFAIFCADAYISHFLDALKAAGLSPRRVISWMKPNAVPVNRAYMPTSAVEYIIVGVKGGKATFNADVNIVEQSLGEKLIEATIVADKVSNIVGSQVKKAILETSFAVLGEVGSNEESGAESSEKANQAHVDKVLELVRESLSGAIDTVVDRVDNMYKGGEGERYLQACVPNYVSLPLKTGNRIHPTEKPVVLLQYLLALYSKQGDKVLDPFAGSGSTGEACLTLGRVPLLIEREAEYYAKAKARLSKFI